MFSNTAPIQREVLHSISHSEFNVLNIMTRIGCIMEWWPHIIRIIYIFLKLQLPECIKPKQSLAPPPPTPSIQPTSLNLSQILCCSHEPASRFLTNANSNIIHSPLSYLPKASNLSVTSCQQPAINASCRQ